jgi:hypothetical protein
MFVRVRNGRGKYLPTFSIRNLPTYRFMCCQVYTLEFQSWFPQDQPVKFDILTQQPWGCNSHAFATLNIVGGVSHQKVQNMPGDPDYFFSKVIIEGKQNFSVHKPFFCKHTYTLRMTTPTMRTVIFFRMQGGQTVKRSAQRRTRKLRKRLLAEERRRVAAAAAAAAELAV